MHIQPSDSTEMCTPLSEVTEVVTNDMTEGSDEVEQRPEELDQGSEYRVDASAEGGGRKRKDRGSQRVKAPKRKRIRTKEMEAENEASNCSNQRDEDGGNVITCMGLGNVVETFVNCELQWMIVTRVT